MSAASTAPRRSSGSSPSCARASRGRAGRRPHAHRRPRRVRRRDRESPTSSVEPRSPACRHSRPSRALVACGDAAADAVADAERLLLADAGRRAVDRLLRARASSTGRRGGDALASMAASLLLPDLPVFLLWTAPPDFDRPVFEALRHAGDTARDRLDAVPGHARRARRGGGARTARWSPTWPGRRSPAGGRWSRRSSTIPTTATLLGRLEHVAIDYIRGSDAQARLLGGWLVAGTGCEAVVTTRPVERADMRAGSLTHVQLDGGGRALHRGSPAGGDGRDRGPGPCDAAGRAARAAVRGADRRGARVPHERPRLPGGPGCRRGARG